MGITKIGTNKFLQFLAVLPVLLFYQNCSDGFESNQELLSSFNTSCSQQVLSEYLAEIKPIFNKSGCVACHGPDGVARNTKFHYGDNYSDADVILSFQDLVSTSEYSQSLILQKPSNQVSHAGGEIIDKDSEGYQKLERFVQSLSDRNHCNQIVQCSPEESLYKKKVRRLTQLQIKRVMMVAFNNAGWVNSGDFGAFFISPADKGFTNDSEKLGIDSLQLSRWYKEIEKRNQNFYLYHLTDKKCRTAMTDECLYGVIDKYALLLLRRPLNKEERQDLYDTVMNLNTNGASFQDQYSFVHKYLLMHPSFFFRTEVGFHELKDGGLVELDNYEIASFLSFTILDGPPDVELYEMAKNGLLKDKVELRKQVDRLVALPEAKLAMQTYLIDLLKLDKTHSINMSRFRGKPSNSISLVNEANLFIQDRIGDNLNYMDIFSGNNYALSDKTAGIYGFTSAEIESLSISSPPKFFALDPQQRNGILTHPTFLSTHSNVDNTGMIKRGVFMLEQLLCHEIPSAPADIPPLEEFPTGYDPTTLSSRRKLELIHSGQPACVSCHQSIDNIGGGLENFDNRGAFRLTETFKVDKKSYTVDIDATGKIDGIGDLNIEYENSVDLSRKIASSDYFKSCMDRRLMEYVSGEKMTKENSCAFEQHNKAMESQSPNLKSFIEEYLKMNAFESRSGN